MNYTNFRSNLAGTMDLVNENHIPVLVTRQSGKPAILMSLEDFNSYEETAYLMSSPANAQRIDEAIRDIENNKGIRKDIIDE